MQAPVKTMPESGTSIGWTWFSEELPGLRKVFHNGDTFGQMSKLDLIPDKGFALAVLTNSISSAGVLAAAEAEALRQYLRLDATAPSLTEESMSSEQLPEHARRYEVP